MTRPTKTEYYLNLAAGVAARSTCLRRQYGAVIVKNDTIVSTGYNGSARNEPNCCDVGVCYRQEHDIPHGEQYEKCQAVHAEANAIINASKGQMHKATLYLAGFENGKRLEDVEPCEMCKRMIRNAGISKVITRTSDGVSERRIAIDSNIVKEFIEFSDNESELWTPIAKDY